MTDRYHSDIDAISTWERDLDEPHFQSYGRRREPAAVCYECGCDVADRPNFGDLTCGKPECRERAASRSER